MAKLDKYLALKKRVETAQQRANRAEGAEKEVMKQIKDEFGCSTLKLAGVELKQLKKREAASKEKFGAAYEQFEEDWPEEAEEE